MKHCLPSVFSVQQPTRDGKTLEIKSYYYKEKNKPKQTAVPISSHSLSGHGLGVLQLQQKPNNAVTNNVLLREETEEIGTSNLPPDTSMRSRCQTWEEWSRTVLPFLLEKITLLVTFLTEHRWEILLAEQEQIFFQDTMAEQDQLLLYRCVYSSQVSLLLTDEETPTWNEQSQSRSKQA